VGRTGTLIDASDAVTLFSDEGFSDEERETLEDGDTDLAEGADLRMMTLIRSYKKADKNLRRTGRNNGTQPVPLRANALAP